MLGVTIGMTQPVRAEDRNPAPGGSVGSTVKDDLRRARRARASGQWAEAHAAYKAAFEAIDATWDTEREAAEIGGELGLCELALRKYRDAAEHLAWSLERRKALSPAQQKRFGKGLADAVKRVATLYLSVDPPDAEVLIDGTPIGRPRRTYRLFFEPGMHMVRALARGRGEAFQSLDARAGAETKMTLQLPRAAESSAGEDAPAGLAKTAVTEPQAATTSARAPAASASWPGTLRIGGAALATAALATGTVLLLRADVIDGNLAERDVARRRRGWTSTTCWWPDASSTCAEIRKEVAGRDRLATLGNVALATGAVFGIATAASFLAEGWLLGGTPAREGVRVAPSTTGTQAGLVVQGVW
ncbi:hypothetical protein [Sorangium cellulosum]|nr:hypothetical protein [Sorangium cellulosum]